MIVTGSGLLRFFSSLNASSSSVLRKRSSPDLQELISEGDNHLKEGRLDPALRLYRKAARIDPGNSAEKRSALVLGMMGRYMEAIASLDRAIEIAPSDHQIWMHRGFLFWRLERWKDALASFERAAALSPEDGYARHCIGVTAEEIRGVKERSRKGPLRTKELALKT
ncbi:MAG TPA: tetratricopeptide repeat protein [Methanothrix sp.]|nr:tetratricopeptide repeat protein [Methanothrix sp.]